MLHPYRKHAPTNGNGDERFFLWMAVWLFLSWVITDPFRAILTLVIGAILIYAIVELKRA
jgi:hypothetical protein